MKKLFAVLTAVFTLFIFSGAVFAEPKLEQGKVNPAYTEYWKMSQEERSKRVMPRMTLPSTKGVALSRSNLRAAALPAKYDLRDYNHVTSVKNQGARGTCWTFSSLAMLESYLLKAAGKSYDFSEMHMDYATSKYCPGGSKYFNGVINTGTINKSAGMGGNIDTSGPYLFTEKGVVNEKTMPFNQYAGVIALSSVKNAASADIWVKDYAVFPSQSVTYVNSSGTINLNDYKNMVKSHIMNYGAMDVTMNGGTYFNASTKAFYESDNTISQADHAVTLVGWDDTYSKNNFTPDTPANDGAWIIRNSWGTGSNENGYFYMSYEDKAFYQANAGVQKAVVGKKYDKMYSYDPMGHNSYWGSELSNTIYGMNVFDGVEGEKLKSITVGFHNPASYEIYVNQYGGAGNVSSMTKVASGRYDYEGFKTIDLSSPITLYGGKFAIAVKYTSSAGAYLPTETRWDGAYEDVSANAGESYLSWDGSGWIDISTAQYRYSNCSIKAFTDKPAPDFIAEPKGVKATAVDNNTIRVTWEKVNGATKYWIYASNKPTGTFQIVGSTAGANSFTHKNLNANTPYYYRIKALKVYNGKNVHSILSKTTSVRTKNDLIITGVTAPASAKVGDTITIKADITGNTAKAKYKFVWSCDNGKSGVIRDYNIYASASVKLQYSGKYKFTVYVMDAKGTVTSKDITTTVTDPYQFSISSVTAPAKANMGQTVTIKAAVKGNTSGLRYKFVWNYNNWNKWGVIRNYSTSNTASFKLNYVGTYNFHVDVMAADGRVLSSKAITVSGDPSNFNLYSVTAPARGKVGQTVTIKGLCSGNTYGLKYKFVWNYNNWSKWGVIRNFGTGNTASFKLQYPGTYNFHVDVMSTNGKVISRKAGTISTLGWNVTGTSVSNTRVKRGTKVRLAPVVSGGSDLKYKFVWSYNNWSKWGVISNFSPTRTIYYTPTLKGRYDLYIDVKDAYGNIKTVSRTINVS